MVFVDSCKRDLAPEPVIGRSIRSSHGDRADEPHAAVRAALCAIPPPIVTQARWGVHNAVGQGGLALARIESGAGLCARPAPFVVVKG